MNVDHVPKGNRGFPHLFVNVYPRKKVLPGRRSNESLE